MMRQMCRTFCAIILIQCIFSVSSQTFSSETKDKFLKGFLSYLNGLPNEPYTFEEGIISDLQHIENNNYKLEASLKVSEVNNSKLFKLLRCSATITESPDGTVLINNHTCNEAEQNDAADETGTVEEETFESSSYPTTVAYDHNRPVELFNEVQPDSTVTSGEQFVAIPRTNPPVPCIGCSVHVNPEAQGVPELATLGVRHIDRHEPGVKHSLNSVVDVERQVQVVNGVRYVLTLLIDYDSCKDVQTSEQCLEVKPCKISILEKPWVKLNDGSKYRAIVANNCTAEWLYGDNGEVISNDDQNKENNEILINPNQPTNNDDNGYDYPKPQTNFGPDDNIQQIHKSEVQATPEFEKHLTEEDIKNIEDQIVPYKDHTTDNSNIDTKVEQIDSEILKSDKSNLYSNNFSPVQQKENVDSNNPNLSEDKKKAIDDLMNFFTFAGLDYKNTNTQENIRMKRSFANDLEVINLFQKYGKLKKQIDNAKRIYSVGQVLIKYINDMDMTVKNRILQEVVAADEDNEDNKKILFMKVSVTIPYETSASNKNNGISQICNGILDVTTEEDPKVVNYFCHRDTNQNLEVGKVNDVPLDDPVLLHLSKLALNTIETESSSPNAIKIQNIVDATTTSGTLTQIAIMIVDLDCNKTVPLYLRYKCNTLEDLGSKLCEVIIHESQTKKITYTCNESRFTGLNQLGNLKNHEFESKIEDMAQEALQYLETESNKLNKLKLVEIKSVKTQIVSGILTHIKFTVGYTDCENNGANSHIENCKLLKDEPLRKCEAQFWIRPWLENGKQMNVSCSDNINQKINNAVYKRDKRSNFFVGGQTSQDITDPQYKSLAEESLQQLISSSADYKGHKLLEIESVTKQVVAGSLTRIHFKIAPQNGCSSTSCKADVVHCESKVWEKPWMSFKNITVKCEPNNEKTRKKRDTTLKSRGSKKPQDPSLPLYTTLAEESLQKYLVENAGLKQHHKMVKVNEVFTQTVSGKLTYIDFQISPTNCQLGADREPTSSHCEVKNPDSTIPCHSEVWERPWLKSKEITVNCGFHRVKRHLKFGDEHEQNIADDKYKNLAENALQKYSKKHNVHHQLLSVDHVTKKIVSGIIYNIDFTAVPTDCFAKNKNKLCKRKKNLTSYCHARIWSRNWLNKNEITVSCNEVHHDDNDLSQTSTLKPTRKAKSLVMDEATVDPHALLVEKALQKYREQNRLKEKYKVININKVNDFHNDGRQQRIEFTISPIKCKSKNKCYNKICHAVFKDLEWIEAKDIKISCQKETNAKTTYTFDGDVSDIPTESKRNIRQTRIDDDDIDEHLKFYYAERAVNDLNNHGKTQNMQKLISIHSIHTSRHMDTILVRMYIETAMTYCLQHHKQDSDLQNCAEIEGLNHKMCLARIWPSPDDDFIINHMSIICDDDENFNTVTGLSINEMIQASLKEVEKSPDIVYKMVPYGEPHFVPSLDSSVPVKLNFIVASTNCTKDMDIFLKRHNCIVDTTRTSKVCRSLIWMVPNSRKILKIRASCESSSKTMSNARKRRDTALDIANTTLDDLVVNSLVQESINELEMSSLHKYKQRLLRINDYSSKISTGKVTTINFDVGYTSCLKFEYVNNITECQFLDHLPKRHCTSHIYERLWVRNGKQIEVSCEDEETPVEAHIEFENPDTAKLLAEEALKHIEAKYPHPKKQKVVRIFSLEKQLVAGIHYRMKLEVGQTNCPALTAKTDCDLGSDRDVNRFCRVNVWVRPWTDNPPNYRVSCDYQDGATSDAYYQIQAEHLFFDFLTTYRPKYSNDPVETKKRFNVFKENIKRIHELNIHERGTARYAVTRFSDLTYEEFASKHTGLKTELRDYNNIPMRQAKIPDVTPPKMYDWRDYGAVTEVKNQGSCGSCWAFSVTGNIEGQWKISSGKLVSLSEQELVDCDKTDSGCNGGYMDNAYRAIEQLGGLETESDYPYEGDDEKCSFNKTLSRVQISGAVNISSNETDMAKWLVKNGPISIGINANAMQFYVGGVSHPWRMLCSPTNLDHGVLIVGYGIKDYPLFHKKLPYWIVKNSWGPSWGEQGYYRVYRGDGTCGVNKMASSAVI